MKKKRKYGQDIIYKIKRLKMDGVSNKEIAQTLRIPLGTVQWIIQREGLTFEKIMIEDVSAEGRRHLSLIYKKIPPEKLRHKIQGENAKRTAQAKIAVEGDKRFGGLRLTAEIGYLVGFIISGKCGWERRVYFFTKDQTLAKTYKDVLAKYAKNKIIEGKVQTWGRELNQVSVNDKTLATFLQNYAREILDGNLLKRVRTRQADLWKGILMALFDDRGKVSGSPAGSFPAKRRKAVRLYIEGLPPGAVRLARFALKKLRIKYIMQGQLSTGERKDYQKLTIYLNKRYIKGTIPERNFRGIDKMLFPKDVAKRKVIKTRPCIKIKNQPENLLRFREITGFRTKQKSELDKFINERTK